MGWHSKHIMGGDAPDEYKWEIMDIIGAKYNESNKGPRYLSKRPISELLTEKQNDIFAIMNKKRGSEGKNIALQVMGVVMLEYGAELQPKIKKAILKACDDDLWGKQNLERKIYLNDFKSIVNSYDGKTPTEETIDHEKKFGVTHKDWIRGRFSDKVAKMAMSYYLEHVKNAKWFNGMELGINHNGYYLVIVGDDSKKYKSVFNSPSFEWSLFEIPVVLISNKDFKKI